MIADNLLTDEEFEAIRKLLLAQSAIVLEPSKRYLVATRLEPLVQKLNLNSMSELIARLRLGGENGLYQQVIEAMVITESSFFRDHHPFEALRTSVIPELINRRRTERRLFIWCAACSSGQEPYSIALLLREHFPELAGWKVSIQACDLSREVLERAKAGVYKQIEVNRGLPASLLVKYFVQHGTDWQVDQTIRDMVQFQEMNLAQPWPMLPRMDLILIRNVMIYFGAETKKSILTKAAGLLRSDGYLLLGGAETPINLVDCYRRIEPIKSGFYQLVG